MDDKRPSTSPGSPISTSTGWTTHSYVGYSNDTTYALSVTGDVIVSQTDMAYDDAGNSIQATTRQRYHNASAAQTGRERGPPTNGTVI
ncbi:hypothetical protein [Allorhodopirellula heiligendammensis]|uniref:Uncharacterized protein n=1 Tax=Allorhodopirellula heiligendammensis TaxID=2714739 RepID=A0A5C6BEM3_9BACT|nr:hypothetical protein [Allorhodopirellula heiligendammensis]TWU10625.1 hypothetical protein Poly21_45310 [Allorhodopirellula heiligendammensis]